VPEIRAIDQRTAMTILQAIHRYAETGAGGVKTLSGKLDGLLRLRVGNHRVLFDETVDSITIHRVGNRREVYR
jgi:mRNA-degrading endonuclease RelE of RelBE toxin-antitoxin system